MVKATQLRPGMVIRHEGELYTVFSVDHPTPGNKRGQMQTKMRNLRSGSIIDYRFRAEEFVERAVFDEVEFEFLYGDAEGFHFMNTQTYEQMTLQKDLLGDTTDYLIPNLPVKLEFYENKPIGVLLPDTVDLTASRNRAQHPKSHSQRSNEESKAGDRPSSKRPPIRKQRRQNQSRHNRSPLHPKNPVIPVGEGALALPHFGHLLQGSPSGSVSGTLQFPREPVTNVRIKTGRKTGGLKHPPLRKPSMPQYTCPRCGQEYVLSPEQDFQPLCTNCQKMCQR